MLAKRHTLDNIELAAAAEAISRPLVEAARAHSPRSPGTVASYLPIRGEIDPGPAVDRLIELGWKVVLPVCGQGGVMDFCPWLPGDSLVSNRYGIDEPATAPVALQQIDLVIVPAVAFDRMGNRLGHGVGFYDRFFARCSNESASPYRVGVAHPFQVVELPAPQPWDVPVQSVVSPTEVVVIPVTPSSR